MDQPFSFGYRGGGVLTTYFVALRPPCPSARTPTTLTARGLDDLVGSVNESEGMDAYDEVGSAAQGGEETGTGVDEGEGSDEEEEEEEAEDDEFSEEADEVELLGEFMLEGEVRRVLHLECIL